MVEVRAPVNYADVCAVPVNPWLYMHPVGQILSGALLSHGRTLAKVPQAGSHITAVYAAASLGTVCRAHCINNSC